MPHFSESHLNNQIIDIKTHDVIVYDVIVHINP